MTFTVVIKIASAALLVTEREVWPAITPHDILDSDQIQLPCHEGVTYIILGEPNLFSVCTWVNL